eukprot:CAMPEP_0167750868 /NCGR_PEP_ID=MMETSP0110_2-20121227/6232_1 /TAXON_ID=629695 /ORGANISM="Gymnochlora sp., Strain CCMP2014" /LENGTH=730 /DNA_ID=CAMNT_0007636241 /DNA_START=12 /DNA_END=2204 /DNA_ORIENTATION=-
MPSRRNKMKKLRNRRRNENRNVAEPVEEEKILPAQKPNEEPVQDGDDLDDWTESWKACKEGNGVWGGRGRGGRGIQRRNIHGTYDDIIVEGVTLAYDGKILLNRSRLALAHNRRYALIGPNGCGKSTLLRRLSRKSLPGVPLSVKIAYVSQELPGNDKESAVSVLVKALAASGNERDAEAKVLVEEQKNLEELITGEGGEEEEEMVERLCQISERLEYLGIDENGELKKSELKRRRLEAKTQTDQALKLLKRLGFTNKQASELPTAHLSGGYRMRLALACALISRPDVLALDEPTNHLDLPGVLWLQKFLHRACNADVDTKTQKSDILRVKTVIFVSHDRIFLDAVATDIIQFEMRTKTLSYHPMGYAEFVEIEEQKKLFKQRTFDKGNKKIEEAKNFLKKVKQQASVASKKTKCRGFDTNLQKVAKSRMMKAEKAGYFRSDGRRYRMWVVKKIDAKAMRRPEKVTAEEIKREREIQFKFPKVEKASLRLADDSTPLISLENVVCGYRFQKDDGKNAWKVILRDVNLNINLKSRVAVVGPNGAGKSTLLNVIRGSLPQARGSLTSNRNVRIACVSQHHIESLKSHLDRTPTELLCEKFSNVSPLDARSHLGAFGLVGKLAIGKIRSLSGGQKARLALSLVTWTRPHVLILDEPTNHLDMASLDGLSNALNVFEGAVVVVSHNQDFLCRVCNELWWVEGGKVRVRNVDTTSSNVRDDFFTLFQKYAEATAT